MINRSFKDFKNIHKKKINQVIYSSLNAKNENFLINLINNFFNVKNSFVFESVEKGKIRGRYTIFGKDPDKIWEFNNNQAYFINSTKRKKIKGSPKKIIEKIIENFKFKIPRGLPPISSIISGYFSYDIIRYIENIPNSCNNDLHLPDVRLIRPVKLIIYDNLKKKIYFIFNCFKDQKITNYNKKFNYIKDEISNLKKLISLKKNIPKKKLAKKVKIKSNIKKKKFLSMVNKAKKYIKNGDIFQVVLSQRFETNLSKSPLEIYKKLRITNPSPFMYFFNFSDFQIIGASPEILVRLRDNKITIRPIAGTRPRGINNKQDNFYIKDLLKDKKELSEHLMLLDLGRNDVGKVSKINTVKVTEHFKIEKYSHVMHIVSNVVGDFNYKNSKFKSLLSGFPAGTVSGAPKIRAMEIIDELEKSKRKVYAGGIGYFSSNGDFDTCIALRTALAKNNKFYVQSGAGIVADSKSLNEYKETVNKAKALINALR
ncbi:MAG TPA: anthranilate synthase component I [Candidatus Pelagibacter bacterium]|jgi:anthranilate synthase component 1|nr:anthranilate synthase component I [Candidatus Pelagibacter bacterium]|tara:strand:+ start:4020 stop:5474 length:1455 start_codon:yes stop_codon:yes gene_type:complete